MWLFPLLSPSTFRFNCSNDLLCILYSPFQYVAPDQAPASYLEHAPASHLSSDVPSESALPALAELVACRDMGHPVTLSLSHVPQLFSWIPLLLPTLTQPSLFSVRPLVKLVSQRSLQTPHHVCWVREVGPSFFQTCAYFFSPSPLNKLPISIGSGPFFTGLIPCVLCLSLGRDPTRQGLMCTRCKASYCWIPTGPLGAAGLFSANGKSFRDKPVCSVLSLPKLGTRHWLLNVLLPTCSSIPRMSQCWRK